jgi:hypothetical protein
MASGILGRSAWAGMVVILGVASSPRIQAASAPPVVTATMDENHATTPANIVPVRSTGEIGRGWGSMIGCGVCLVAAGTVVAGGPSAIIAAANFPGSAGAVMACAAACYEAFQ